jgi:CheY-like chemotaxis protein
MPTGGNLTFTANRETLGDPSCQLAPGEYVCIQVIDTGAGMDETTLARAAEPFFTTKGVGKGTGLGLSIAHGLAAQSGGAMRVASRVGHGTTVSLWLPVDQTEAPLTKDSNDATASAESNFRVMVVDDDPLVLDTMTALLEDLGHTVMQVDSGGSAIELLTGGVEVDLVITDYAMPMMTGLELAASIRKNWPQIPVILASGYADIQDVDNLQLPRLAKPIKQLDLDTCIVATLEGCSVGRKFLVESLN